VVQDPESAQVQVVLVLAVALVQVALVQVTALVQVLVLVE
jgi:hypothetical protein